jgi:hypothetical protein
MKDENVFFVVVIGLVTLLLTGSGRSISRTFGKV